MGQLIQNPHHHINGDIYPFQMSISCDTEGCSSPISVLTKIPQGIFSTLQFLGQTLSIPYYDKTFTKHLLKIFFPLSPHFPPIEKNEKKMKKTSNVKNSHWNGERHSQEHGFPAGLRNLQAFTCSFRHQRVLTPRLCPRYRHLDCIKLPGGMCAKLQYGTVIKKAACLLFLCFVRKVIV